MIDTGYRGFRQKEMEYQYNPRESVPEYPQLAKKRAGYAKARNLGSACLTAVCRVRSWTFARQIGRVAQF